MNKSATEISLARIFEHDNAAVCSSCEKVTNQFLRCRNCGCKVCGECSILSGELCHACLEGTQDY